MCCFSGPVQSVSNTRIFARNSGLTNQFLVYEMNFSAKDDLAMILPIEGFDVWTESMQPAGMFVDVGRSRGIVDDASHVYKRIIHGRKKNEDILA